SISLRRSRGLWTLDLVRLLFRRVACLRLDSRRTRIIRGFVKIGDAYLTAKQFVVVVKNLDAVMHINVLKVEYVFGFSSGGEGEVIPGWLPPRLEHWEALFALRLDDSFDFDNLESSRIEPDSADKVALLHVVRIRLNAG